MIPFVEFVKDVKTCEYSSMQHRFVTNYSSVERDFIEDLDMTLLLEALQGNKKLKELEIFFRLINQHRNNYNINLAHLSYTGISLADVKNLSTIIEKNKTLSKFSIDLSNHYRIGKESSVARFNRRNATKSGTEMLADAMSKNKTLSSLTLNLSHTDTGDKGAKALSKAIEKNTSLKYLALPLSFNCISKEGVISLSKAVQKNTTLSTFILLLNGNLLTGYDIDRFKKNSEKQKNYDAFYALSEMLAENKSLKRIFLHLPNTGIDAKAVDIILDGIKKNQSLTTIDFKISPFSNNRAGDRLLFLGLADEEVQRIKKEREMLSKKIKTVIDRVTLRNSDKCKRRMEATDIVLSGRQSYLNNCRLFTLMHAICQDENCSYLNKTSNDENSVAKMNSKNNHNN